MAFPRRLLVDDEELVLDLRPHWIELVGPSLVILLVVIGWIIAFVNMPDSGVWTWVRWALVGAGSLVIVAYSLRHIVDWLTDNFCVTSDRVIHRHGLIAKRSMEIPLEHINDVRFEQKVWERMIGAGTLVIHSASETGRQEFSNVRNPEHVQKTIYHEGEKNQQRMRGGGFQAPQAPTVTSELHRLADLRDRGVLTQEEFETQKARILGAGFRRNAADARMIAGLDHVYYWTADMDAAVAFYRDVLGLPLRRRDGDAWAEFDAGPVHFALHGGRGTSIPSGGTAVFRVEDLDAARFAIEQRGARVEGTGEVEGLARFVTVHDPDGNVVQLIEYRPDPA